MTHAVFVVIICAVITAALRALHDTGVYPPSLRG